MLVHLDIRVMNVLSRWLLFGLCRLSLILSFSAAIMCWIRLTMGVLMRVCRDVSLSVVVCSCVVFLAAHGLLFGLVSVLVRSGTWVDLARVTVLVTPVTGLLLLVEWLLFVSVCVCSFNMVRLVGLTVYCGLASMWTRLGPVAVLVSMWSMVIMLVILGMVSSLLSLMTLIGMLCVISLVHIGWTRSPWCVRIVTLDYCLIRFVLWSVVTWLVIYDILLG